jgi:hypothetical protein
VLEVASSSIVPGSHDAGFEMKMPVQKKKKMKMVFGPNRNFSFSLY